MAEYFVNKRVLNVSSGDINGNNRVLFEDCEYEGNAVILANNVTIYQKLKICHLKIIILFEMLIFIILKL